MQYRISCFETELEVRKSKFHSCYKQILRDFFFYLSGQFYFPTPLAGITQQTAVTVVMPLTSMYCKCLKIFPQNYYVVPAAIY